MTRNKMPVEKCMKIVEDIINENISIYIMQQKIMKFLVLHDKSG
ncbi:MULTISPECIES: hypothetical protein [Staphylococcus]|nr:MULTISPECIES: hypothetical protein [Staphylococcus]